MDNNLIEQIEIFNTNYNILPKDGKYIVKVFSFKKLITQKSLWTLIKGLLGMDIQEVVYRVVLYLNNDTVAEIQVEPDAWDEIKDRTIKDLIRYAESHYNNTFTITDNLKSLAQEYKNECEYLNEK